MLYENSIVLWFFFFFFFFNDTATTEIYTLSLHDALPISVAAAAIAHHVPGDPEGERADEDEQDRRVGEKGDAQPLIAALADLLEEEAHSESPEQQADERQHQVEPDRPKRQGEHGEDTGRNRPPVRPVPRQQRVDAARFSDRGF